MRRFFGHFSITQITVSFPAHPIDTCFLTFFLDCCVQCEMPRHWSSGISSIHFTADLCTTIDNSSSSQDQKKTFEEKSLENAIIMWTNAFQKIKDRVLKNCFNQSIRRLSWSLWNFEEKYRGVDFVDTFVIFGPPLGVQAQRRNDGCNTTAELQKHTLRFLDRVVVFSAPLRAEKLVPSAPEPCARFWGSPEFTPTRRLY